MSALVGQGIAAYVTLHGLASVAILVVSVMRAASNLLFAAAYFAAASRLYRMLSAPAVPAAPVLGEPAE